MVLVALLGRADLHAAAGEVLQRRHDREHFINYIGIPDAHGAARLFGARLAALADRGALSAHCASQPVWWQMLCHLNGFQACLELLNELVWRTSKRADERSNYCLQRASLLCRCTCKPRLGF